MHKSLKYYRIDIFIESQVDPGPGPEPPTPDPVEISVEIWHEANKSRNMFVRHHLLMIPKQCDIL